ncbi:MAG: efflux transporter outer membrane subunit [Planctomycetota bacterium]|nr:efflux transporter outer membrane subunit [Planctomycetota bacterium]
MHSTSGGVLRLHLTSLTLVLLASGCRTGPEHCEPLPSVPDAWHQELVDDGQYVDHLNDWWSTFNDPTLNQLIMQASVNNRDLYAAVTRIQQAAAQQRIAGSPLYPFVDATGSRSNYELSENSPTYLNPRDISPGAPHDFAHSLSNWKTGFNLSWEPDVWGRIARGIEAAEANTAASVENYRDVLVSLHSQVAQSYVLLRQLQAQKAYALQNAEIQNQSLRLAEDRLDAGLVPELDVHQARLNRARTQAGVPRLEAAIQEQLNLLAMLLGEQPGSLHVVLETPAAIPAAQNPADIVIPINVVRRRPDIRSAERGLAAQTARVGVAETDLLPRFSFGGNFGLESEDFSDLFDNESFTFGVGPSFTWAIFRAGQIRNNIEMKEAATEEAVARYEQTILNAFREVETAIADYRQEKLRRNQLLVATQAAAKAVENVSALYRAGKTDFQNVLVTQQSLADMQNQLADSEGRLAINVVKLYKALGGGWQCNDHLRPHACRLGNRLVDAMPVEGDAVEGDTVEGPAPHPYDSDSPELAPAPIEPKVIPPAPNKSPVTKPAASAGKVSAIRGSLKKLANAFPRLGFMRRNDAKRNNSTARVRSRTHPQQSAAAQPKHLARSESIVAGRPTQEPRPIRTINLHGSNQTPLELRDSDQTELIPVNNPRGG